jgi:phosphatidylglycerol:prolipoprotein diacylglycerol transferase
VHPILFHLGPLLIPAYGAMAALGVLLALALAQRTARIAGVNPNQLWNLCIIALFAAIVGSRLLLVLLNWTIVRSHPAWLLGLAMIHHPLLAAVGVLIALAVVVPYARSRRLPMGKTADALAAPLALALACEQIGALLAGSGYGTETSVRWAVVYTHPLAERWSGAPLFVPVHPVQVYAALAFFVIALALFAWMPHRRRQGDVAGIWLLSVGAAVYLTEFFRDPEGRGSLLHGALNGPQLAAVVSVLAGALVLRERKGSRPLRDSATQRADKAAEVSHD